MFVFFEHIPFCDKQQSVCNMSDMNVHICLILLITKTKDNCFGKQMVTLIYDHNKTFLLQEFPLYKILIFSYLISV